METQYLVPRTALQVGRRPDCEASSVVEHAGTLDLSQCGASTPHSGCWMLSIQRLRGRPEGFVLFGRQ